jgi:hypothetical protein
VVETKGVTKSAAESHCAQLEKWVAEDPARVHAADYKKAFAARLTETAREAGATNPEQLGEQLALLLDGASARNRVLNTETFATAAAIAAVLIDNAIPTAAVPPGAGENLSTGTGPRAGSGGELSRI